LDFRSKIISLMSLSLLDDVSAVSLSNVLPFGGEEEEEEEPFSTTWSKRRQKQ